MKVLLVHNREAGQGKASPSALMKAIRRAGWKVRSLPREKADTEAILAARPDLVAVAGGDGTVAKILVLLPDRAIPVAVIPTGTANNIAASLGLIGDPRKLIEGWDLERRQRMDLGNAHGPWGCRPFAEGVGFGAFAESLRRAPDLDGAAKIAAGRRALSEAVRGVEAIPLEIRLDGKKLSGDLLFVEVMNVSMTGPRLRLAPAALPGDGKLHLAFLPAGRRDAMRRWLKLGKGDPPVEQASGTEVCINGGGVTMRIDDESCWLEPESEVTIGLEGEPVQLLAPAGGPALAG